MQTPTPFSSPARRQEALSQLQAFQPFARNYAQHRNHVFTGHPHVSRLSPAIRHRLILETECVEATLLQHSFADVEKFIQEIYWRRYWKSWLSLRPQVWTDYLDQLAAIHRDPQAADLRSRAARCEAGQSPVAIMNHFARELIETGYLHNHARMWFAGWWIHVERLPWQLGAEFFLRHLLDGDPASNTLSWRWVAGLQTPGKTYLPRRSNLEKYLSADLLEKHTEGLEHLEDPMPWVAPLEPRPKITRPTLPSAQPYSSGRIGLWIHEEDLCVERGPLSSLRPSAILALGDSATWTHLRYPEKKTAWLQTALSDAARRSSSAFGVEAQVHYSYPSESSISEMLLQWAVEHRLTQVIALRPEVGPLDDQLESIKTALTKAGIDLLLFDRPKDLAHRGLATTGFFAFWEQVRESHHLVLSARSI